MMDSQNTRFSPFPQPGMMDQPNFPFQSGMDQFGSNNGMMGRGDSQNMPSMPFSHPSLMGQSMFTSRFGPAPQQQTTVIEIVPALASTEESDDSGDSDDSEDSDDSDYDFGSSEESVEDQSQKLVDSIVHTAIANANEQLATARAQGAAVIAHAQAQGAALMASAKAQEAAVMQRLPQLAHAQLAQPAASVEGNQWRSPAQPASPVDSNQWRSPAQPAAPVDGNQWRSWPKTAHHGQ